MKPIKVLVVDDSAVVRQVMTSVLSADAGIEVIGAVADPVFAIQRMRHAWPDVITLDIEMPRMDGLTFLRKIMAERPTPVVICSTLTAKGATATLQALALGAVGIVNKPTAGVRTFLEDSSADLVEQVKAAARVRMAALRAQSGASASVESPGPPGVSPRGAHAPELAKPASEQTVPSVPAKETSRRIVAVGTSTGGTQALETILRALPVASPGLLIVQHMPEHVTKAFAQRLDSICKIEVREAVHNDAVLPGQALIAPGGRHMALKLCGSQYHVAVSDGPLINRHKPSVDVLFRSVARWAGADALGIILTGMGDDGAAGLHAMLEAGAQTVGQDEASCVVYGMPREAWNRGAVQKQLSLGAMAAEITRFR